MAYVDARERIAASKRGKPRSPETVAKMSAATKGQPLSEATKAKKRATIAAKKLARSNNEDLTGGDGGDVCDSI